MQGRPIAGPEPVQEVVEARELVAPGLLEAEVRGRGLPWTADPAPLEVGSGRRIGPGRRRRRTAGGSASGPVPSPRRLPAARTAGDSRRPACSGEADRAG